MGLFNKPTDLEANAKARKIKNILLIIIFFIMSYFMIIVSNGLANYTFNTGDRLKFNTILVSIQGFFHNKKQIQYYLSIEGALLFFTIVLIWLNKQSIETFKSDVMQITEDITIPIAMGEGQHGSARFATDKEKLKIFKQNVIKLSDPFFTEQLKKGEEKIKAVNEFINNRKKTENKTNDLLDIDLSNVSDSNIEIKEPEHKTIISEYNEELESNFTEEYDEILDSINKRYENSEKVGQNSEIKEDDTNYDPKSDPKKFFKTGGLVVGIVKDKKKNEETIYYIEDKHSLTIGATGCGKSRCEVLQTIGNIGLSGESLIVSDPKLELLEYTNEFLKDLGYEVICLDFKNPKKSSKYNILQPIINAYNEGDLELVQNYTEELATILTPESKGEKIWYNGEKSMTSGAILSVVLNNKNNPEVQNMTNVYHFVSSAGGTTINQSPFGETQSSPFIKQYCDDLPNDSLESKAFATVTQAGDKQRESYITSSLSTLRLFSNESMWQITHKTDCNIFKAGERKIALFIGLPDENTSYYPVASTIICQIYNMLVKIADNKYGGTLPVRVNFVLDEFGNFTKIPDLNAKLTVARSRGMKFMLFLQNLSQLNEKYGKETRDIITANCQTWSYLLANDTETLKIVSEKLGQYTVSSGSASISGSGSNINQSTSRNLTGRSLLRPEELQMLKRPYNLVLSENRPAMMSCPDISQISFNKMFAMGDKEHNNNLRLYVEENRKDNSTKGKEKYWDAFKKYRNKAVI